MGFVKSESLILMNKIIIESTLQKIAISHSPVFRILMLNLFEWLFILEYFFSAYSFRSKT